MFSFPFFNFHRTYKIKPTVLVILDGFGLAPASNGNAITLAKTPYYDSFKQHYPFGQLIASGEAVGLPTNEVGNTEVGHLTLGAGRVILQDLKRINLSIDKGTFYDNSAFVQAATNAKNKKTKFHILGLVSSGKVHSSLDHLQALLQFCKKEGLQNVFLHIFTDGRDAPPKEGIEIINKLNATLETMRVGKIASVSGRYYAMDRDRRWARTERAYCALVEGEGVPVKSAEEAAERAYAKGLTDEFIEPSIVMDGNAPLATIDNDDSVVFFNYRIDRAKQLAMSLILPGFEDLGSFDFGYSNKKTEESSQETPFKRKKTPQNLCFVTMSEYQKGLPVSAIAFGPEIVDKSLPEVISNSGLAQMHISESEKERFVTYYFDGMHEEKFKGEEKLIVPSVEVSTYDLKPEMSVFELVKKFKKELKKDIFHFFVLNFANPDMVGHTGNLPQAVKAIEYVDTALNDLVQSTLRQSGMVVVTADHGNVEEMLTFPSSTFFFTTESGILSTDHSINPVPVLFLANHLYDVKIDIPKGQLSDVAPTILSSMGLPVPSQMTGKNLLENLKSLVPSSK